MAKNVSSDQAEIQLRNLASCLLIGYQSLLLKHGKVSGSEDIRKTLASLTGAKLEHSLDEALINDEVVSKLSAIVEGIIVAIARQSSRSTHDAELVELLENVQSVLRGEGSFAATGEFADDSIKLSIAGLILAAAFVLASESNRVSSLDVSIGQEDTSISLEFELPEEVKPVVYELYEELLDAGLPTCSPEEVVNWK